MLLSHICWDEMPFPGYLAAWRLHSCYRVRSCWANVKRVLSSFRGPSSHIDLETVLPAAFRGASYWGPSLAASRDPSIPRQLLLVGFMANTLFSWDKTLHPAQSDHCGLEIWLSCYEVHPDKEMRMSIKKPANTLESGFLSQHSHFCVFCLCEPRPASSPALLC